MSSQAPYGYSSSNPFNAVNPNLVPRNRFRNVQQNHFNNVSAHPPALQPRTITPVNKFRNMQQQYFGTNPPASSGHRTHRRQHLDVPGMQPPSPQPPAIHAALASPKGGFSSTFLSNSVYLTLLLGFSRDSHQSVPRNRLTLARKTILFPARWGFAPHFVAQELTCDRELPSFLSLRIRTPGDLQSVNYIGSPTTVYTILTLTTIPLPSTSDFAGFRIWVVCCCCLLCYWASCSSALGWDCSDVSC